MRSVVDFGDDCGTTGELGTAFAAFPLFDRKRFARGQKKGVLMQFNAIRQHNTNQETGS